jgi:hypothetical protein
MSVHTLGSPPVGGDLLGLQGDPGINGVQGAIGSGIQGEHGSDGVAGSQGVQGPIGLQGTQGIQGAIASQGTSGFDGLSGDFVETQYAKNGSPTSAPSIVTTNLNPVGWSITPPVISSLEYLWMTQSRKNFAGNALVINWTTPVRVTGEFGTQGTGGINGVQGAGGSNGLIGPLGPSPIFRGDWSNSETYYGNSARVDIVRHGLGSYFVTRTDAPVDPHTNKEPDIETTYWNSFGAYFDSVATGLLFADLAYVDNLGVRNFEGQECPSGTLDGSIQTVQANAPVAYDIWGGIIQGTSGYMEVRANGVTQTVSYNTDLSVTAAQYVFEAFYGNDVTITNPGAPSSSIQWLKQTGGLGAVECINSQGVSFSSIQCQQTYSAPVAQIDEVTLSGVGGSCTINTTAGNAQGIAIYSYSTVNGSAQSLVDTAADFLTNNVVQFNTSGIDITTNGEKIVLTAVDGQLGTQFTTTSSNIPLNTLGSVGIRENEIFEPNVTNSGGGININRLGYNGGTSQARDLFIGDGKGNMIIKVDGSSRRIFAYIPSSDYPNGLVSGSIFVDASGFLKLID